MRNLKRALSLTLASVMLLGMMVVGSSALSFNDADDISNVTAATVLEELGVMVGDGAGNFMPNQTVTRAQMAILICRILYGSNLNVSQFEGVTQYTDVPVTEYYTGYINLATQLGIIGGYGDGRFGPDDTVTTAQAALMLSRALGYFKANELEGQDWALAAVAQATKINMFGDLKLATNEGLARDNVAEMVFNAMTKATPVMYNDLWHMYYTDSESIMSGIKFSYDETLGYRNYDLVYTSGEDDFGRPTTIWGTGDLSRAGANVIKDNGSIDTTIFTNIPQTNQIVEEADKPTASYDGKVSRVTLYNLLGRSAVNRLETNSNTTDGNSDTPHWNVFTDGEEYTGYNKTIFFDREDTTSIGRRTSPSTATTASGDSATDLTGDGTHTDVYVDNDGNVTIAISNTYVIKATNDYSSRSNSVTTALISNNGSKTSAQIGIPSSELTLSGEDFDVANVKMDDYLLITVAGSATSNKEIQTVIPANIITGSVNEFDDDNVVIDGVKYGYGFTADSTSSHGKTVTYAVGEDTSVVADKDGHILYVDEVTVSAGRFVYIADTDTKTGDFTTGKFVADAYFLDGTNKTIDINKKLKHADGSADTNITGTESPGWYRYTVSSDVYKLELLESGGAENQTGSVSTPGSAADEKLTENGNTTVGVNAAVGKVRANANTIFVVIDEDDDVKAYTGIDNAPTVQSTAAASLTAHYVLGTNGAYAKYVFIDASANATVDAGASDEIIFLLKSVRDGTDGKEVTYRLWEGIVNGELRKDIKVATGCTTNIDGDSNVPVIDRLYGNVRYDSDGYIRAMDAVDSGDNYIAVNGVLGTNVTYEGDVLSLSATVAPNAKEARVWLIARDGNLMTKGSSYEVIGTNSSVTNGSMSASGLYGYLRIYDVTGNFWVQTADGKANSKATDIYVLVTGTVRNDVADVTMDNGATGAEINSQLGASGTTSVTVRDPAGDVDVAVPGGKTLNLSGSISGGTVTKGSGAGDAVVNVSNATVSGDLDLSAAEDVTLSNITVGAGTEVTVDDATISGTINLSAADSALTVTGTAGFSNVTIKAVAGATITLGGTPYMAAGSGVGVNFYDEEGNLLTFNTRAAVTAGTYEYKVNWDKDGELESAITGFVRTGDGPEAPGTTGKNVLGTISTSSSAAGVSITSAVVKNSSDETVAAEGELAAGDYTLVVTPAEGTTTAPVTITLSGVTAGNANAAVAGDPSWSSTPATKTVVTIDAGKTVASTNTITYTFTVAAATGDTDTTITPVITVATTGANAKLEVGVTFTGTPTWAENDTVTFGNSETNPLNLVMTCQANGNWSATSGTPSGYTATFDGSTLTLTATAKANVADSPFGTITAAVSNAADGTLTSGTVDNANATWTPGVAATPTTA